MGPAIGKHKNTEKTRTIITGYTPRGYTLTCTHSFSLQTFTSEFGGRVFPQNTSMGTAVNEIQKMEKKEYILMADNTRDGIGK